MGWEGYVTCGVVAALIVALARNSASADALLLGAATVLSTMRIFSDQFLDPRDVASALGNQGLVTVAALFVVAAGLAHSGGSSRIGAPILGRPRSTFAAQVRMMLPVTAVSAFLNNTTVVAAFLPVVKDWARTYRLDVTRLLMPLSYAAVLGGVCTLIGTSTNIVVQGLMIDAGMPGMGMFSLTPIGIAIAAAGIVYVVIASRILLPSRTPAAERLANPREYTVEMEVEKASPLDGSSIEKAGLRQLPGLFLAEVHRGDDVEPAVGPEFVLRGGDRLIFVGLVHSVADLTNVRGLVPVADGDGIELDVPRTDRIFCEAVVSVTSPMVGKSIRDGRFRGRYGAAVLAVHRNGELIKQKVGDIVLQPGDTLLVEGPPRFLEEQRDRGDFFLVSAVEGRAPVRHDRGWLSIAILAAVVLGGALEPITNLDVLPFALAGGALMIVTGCCTMEQARRSIDWSVLFSIAGALVVARTLESTGAAAVMASGVVAIAQPLGPTFALAAVYVTTLLLTELLTNNAAAALAFPLAIATAQQLGVSAMPFAIAIAIAASCGFATPTGYQTHLMVYGAGGYRFGDFMRMGAGLDIVCAVIATLLIPLVFPF
ncbi:SLC13 family permease [Sandaracinus amylolyticus]|uniref:SLC13 family permease n=1 Tax=Sandaracinus amylolyticus TaxID=927083 RepID=UPI001F3DA015|nr:SLC13 family permease [Sandaracinus amylolyticus]UJR78966.1 Sodium-dependent dicarboxylate transporter SdcS [Sandaracinus amylolyticus]